MSATNTATKNRRKDLFVDLPIYLLRTVNHPQIGGKKGFTDLIQIYTCKLLYTALANHNLRLPTGEMMDEGSRQAERIREDAFLTASEAVGYIGVMGDDLHIATKRLEKYTRIWDDALLGVGASPPKEMLKARIEVSDIEKLMDGILSPQEFCTLVGITAKVGYSGNGPLVQVSRTEIARLAAGYQRKAAIPKGLELMNQQRISTITKKLDDLGLIYKGQVSQKVTLYAVPYKVSYSRSEFDRCLSLARQRLRNERAQRNEEERNSIDDFSPF